MRHNSKIIEDKYDIIIIGAGIGGLTCGCYLAKAGMKVLIVEQHDKPGGCCTSFERKGITFDAAVHTLASCREDGLLGQVLDELDLRDEIKFTRMNPSDSIINKNYEIPIMEDLNETIDILCNIFPGEVQNIKDFFLYINSLDTTNYRNYLNLRDKRFIDILQNYFNNKDLISILGVLLLNTGMPSCELSAFMSIFMFKEFLQDGGYYPIKGMQNFSDSFVRKFIEYGGTLLLSTKVEKIKIENREVKGCLLQDNMYIRSKSVISNGDARKTYFELIGLEFITQEFFNKMNRLVATPSYFTVYLGLNSPSLRNNKKNGIIWYFPKRRCEKIFSEVFYCREPYLREGVTCNFKPKLNGELNDNSLEVFYIWIAANYMNQKYWKMNRERVADELIKRVEDIFPGVSSLILVRSISTPYDIERYTLNYQGATNGWACTPMQISLPVIKVKTKIKGLYIVGHWVNHAFGGGVPTVAKAAKETAKLIQDREYAK